MNRPIPKSLHTVTVLVKLARHFADWESMPPEDAVRFAMRCLDMHYWNDPHGLEAAALKQLKVKP